MVPLLSIIPAVCPEATEPMSALDIVSETPVCTTSDSPVCRTQLSPGAGDVFELIVVVAVVQISAACADPAFSHAAPIAAASTHLRRRLGETEAGAFARKIAVLGIVAGPPLLKAGRI
jgi:type IV secretory pathway VirB2 component (pilin)